MRTMSVAVVIAMILWTRGVARQPDAFDACAQDKDPMTRLACFDREVAARNAADRTAAPTASPTPPHAAIAPPAETPSVPAQAPAIAAAAAAAPVLAPTTAATPAVSASTRDIGLDALELRRQRAERGEPEPPPAAPIEALIVKVIPRQPMISAFVLDNGQIWEQSEAMKMAAKPDQKVVIRHGVLGAFFLKTPDGVVVRVHRVK
jgi:hypothetical protein